MQEKRRKRKEQIRRAALVQGNLELCPQENEIMVRSLFEEKIKKRTKQILDKISKKREKKEERTEKEVSLVQRNLKPYPKEKLVRYEEKP